MHGIISKLDGTVNRGHEQTYLIITDYAKALTRFRTGGLYTNSITIVKRVYPLVDRLLVLCSQQVVLGDQASDRVPVLSSLLTQVVGLRTDSLSSLNKLFY